MTFQKITNLSWAEYFHKIIGPETELQKQQIPLRNAQW